MSSLLSLESQRMLLEERIKGDCRVEVFVPACQRPHAFFWEGAPSLLFLWIGAAYSQPSIQHIPSGALLQTFHCFTTCSHLRFYTGKWSLFT